MRHLRMISMPHGTGKRSVLKQIMTVTFAVTRGKIHGLPKLMST